jgi:hypothetical protein
MKIPCSFDSISSSCQFPEFPHPNHLIAPVTMKRRPFLRLTGLAGAGLGFSLRHSHAADDPAELLYAKFVPAEKNLPADWLASLTTRGHKLDAAIRYSKENGNLDVIGMTVGGIGCGTVYLSGDGRLWVWDIFNQHHEGVVPNRDTPIPEGLGSIQSHRKIRERDGANFLNPPRASDHRNGVDARFTLSHAGVDRPLDASAWDEVGFTGRWPIGIVDYATAGTPLKVRLESYSPFIPLDLDASALPVTMMEYTIENPTDESAEIVLTGHLNNPCGQFSNREALRFTEAISTKNHGGLFHGLRDDATPAAEPVLDAGSMAIAAISGNRVVVDAENNQVRATLTVPAKGKATARFRDRMAFPKHFPTPENRPCETPLRDELRRCPRRARPRG